MGLELASKEIQIKKTVGKLKGKDVTYVKTIGGLHLMFLQKDVKADLIAAAPHPGVAQFLANENEPGIEWMELSKSNHIEYAEFQHILPEYRTLTAEMRAKIVGKENK